LFLGSIVVGSPDRTVSEVSLASQGVWEVIYGLFSILGIFKGARWEKLVFFFLHKMSPVYDNVCTDQALVVMFFSVVQLTKQNTIIG
jgi:hypothetical protein